MGSLSKCLAKNKIMGEEDISEVSRIYEDNLASGMSPRDAEIAAARTVLAELEAVRDSIWKQIDANPISSSPRWLGLEEIDTPEGPTSINAYFADNPQMMLGKMRLMGTMYRKDSPVLIGSSENLEQKIAEAVRAGLPENAISPRGTTAVDLRKVDTETDGIKDGAYYLKGADLYRKVAGVGELVKAPKAQRDKIEKFLAIRDVVNEMMEIQGGLRTAPEGRMDQLRKALNKSYDAFVKAHGPINKTIVTKQNRKDGKEITIKRYPNLSAFEDDSDAFKVSAIEVYDEKTDTAKKAAIFTQDVVSAYVAPDVQTPSDALAVSLNETGRVDIPLIANKLGISEEEAVFALGDLVYLDPVGEVYRTASEYLAGDVVGKLDTARIAAEKNPDFNRNVEALERVQPEPLTRADIRIPFGAPYVPVEIYEQYLNEVFKGRDIKLKFDETMARWYMTGGSFPYEAETQFGTAKRKVKDLVEAALNSATITISEKDSEGNSIRQPEAEAEARAKVDIIKDTFSGDPEQGIEGWIWGDYQRATRLEATYNNQFNRIVQEKHDGSHLTFPGLARVVTAGDGSTFTIDLKPHRVNAVWKIIKQGNTLLNHAVGSGKTWTSIMAGMEMKRLGMIQRPMYVVPNHMLNQFSTEFYQAYPNAKLLIATKDQVSAKNRKKFAARIAADTWDGIIITHSAFTKMSMSGQAYQDFYAAELEELELAIKNAKEAGEDKTVKDLEKKRQRTAEKLKKLVAEEDKDTGVTFEETGIDFMFVDEAHLFKSLPFQTSHTRVKGISNSGTSKRAIDLYLKMRHLEKSRPGRSAVFMTGTPVSNTMAELFIMQKYLQEGTLKDYGIDKFDAWAATFGDIVTKSELSSNSRDYKDTESFSQFVNMPELMTIAGQIMDTQTAEMLKLPRPELKDGKLDVVEAQLSDEEKAAIDGLIDRMEKRAKDEPFLPLFTAGIQLATDMRLVDPSAPFNPNGKIGKAVENIFKIWEEGNADPAAPNKGQLIFLDMGVPGSKGNAKSSVMMSEEDRQSAQDDATAALDRIRREIAEEAGQAEDGEAVEVDEGEVEAAALLQGKFNLYQDIKDRLVEKGVPAEQIAFIHDAKNDAQKAKMFEKMRSGEIRVMIGSTSKMGVGTNVQKMLYAMHHLDAPWKPADLEQRDGRILRQGNKNKEVRIFRYITVKSFDAYRWQLLDRKSQFIGQLYAGAAGVRHMEDITPPLPEAAELKAAATGNPLIIERAELEREVRKLEVAERTHYKSQKSAAENVKALQDKIASLAAFNERYAQDAPLVEDLKGDNFKVTLDTSGKPTEVTDRKKAGTFVKTYLLGAGKNYWSQKVDLGTMSGFQIRAEVRRVMGGAEVKPIAVGVATYEATDPFVLTEEADPTQVIQKWVRLVSSIPNYAAKVSADIAAAEETLPKMQEAAEPKPFPRTDALGEKRNRLDYVTGRLEGNQPNLEPAINDPVYVAALEKPVWNELKRSLKLGQPFETVDELMEKAAVRHEELTRVGQEIAAELGVTFRDAPFKRRERIEEKLNGEDPRMITDAARGGFDVASPEEADAIMAALSKRFGLVDESWIAVDSGYYDRKVMVRFADGIIGEIQMWPPGMFETKEIRGGHKLYERARVRGIDPNEKAALEQEMRDLYFPVLAEMPEPLQAALVKSASPALRSSLGNWAASSSRDISGASRSGVERIGALLASLQSPESPRTAAASPETMAGSPSQLKYPRSDIVAPPSTQNIGAVDENGNAIAQNAAPENSDDWGDYRFSISGRSAAQADAWRKFTNSLKYSINPPRLINGEYRAELKPGNGTLTYTVHRGKKRTSNVVDGFSSPSDETEIGRFYVRSDATPDGFAVSVQNMSVDAAYRGQGIASAVFDMIEQDIAQAGIRMVPPAVDTLSADGRAFWEARDPDALAAREQMDREPYFTDDVAARIKAGAPGVVPGPFWERQSEFLSEFDRIVDRLPPEVKVNVEKRIRVGGFELDGYYDKLRKLIAVSMSTGPDRALETLRHEEVHALYDLGMFTKEEWKILVKAARDAGLRNDAQIDNAYREQYIGVVAKKMMQNIGYGDLAKMPWVDLEAKMIELGMLNPEDKILSLKALGIWDEGAFQQLVDEEAVANFMGEVAPQMFTGQNPAGIDAVLKRIRDFFEALRNAINGLGFQTLEDVYRAVDVGEVGARDSAWGSFPISFSAPVAASIADPDAPVSPVDPAYVDALNQRVQDMGRGKADPAMALREGGRLQSGLVMFDEILVNPAKRNLMNLVRKVAKYRQDGGNVPLRFVIEWNESGPRTFYQDSMVGTHYTMGVDERKMVGAGWVGVDGTHFFRLFNAEDEWGLENVGPKMEAMTGKKLIVGGDRELTKLIEDWKPATATAIPDDILMSLGRMGNYQPLGVGTNPQYPNNAMEAPEKGLSEVTADLIKAMGLEVRQGRLNPAAKRAAAKAGGKLMGQFSRNTGVTRMALKNDMATLAHEGGHALEVRPTLRADLDAIKAQFAEDLTQPPAPNAPAPQFPRQGFSGLELDQDSIGLAIRQVAAERKLRVTATEVGALKSKVRNRQEEARLQQLNEVYAQLQTEAGGTRETLIRRIGKDRADAVLADLALVPPAQAVAYAAQRFSKAGQPAPRVVIQPTPVELSEGFAEWFRIYLTNPKQAKSLSQGFFDAFEDMMDANEPEMLTRLQMVQDGIDTLAKAAPVSAVRSRVQSTVRPGAWEAIKEQARISMESGKVAADTAARTGEGSPLRAGVSGFAAEMYRPISDWLYSVYHGAIDSRHPMKRAVQYLIDKAIENSGQTLDKSQKAVVRAMYDPYKLWRLAEHSKVHATAALQYGIVHKGSVEPTGPSYWDALTKAFGGNKRGQWNDDMAEQFGSYLIGRRMLAEFARYDAGFLENVPDSLIDRRVWQASVAQLEKENPQFREAAKLLYGFNQSLLEYQYENGFLTPEQYAEYSQRVDYVPLNRIMDDGAPSMLGAGGNVNKRRLIYRFQGSTRDFINPLESIAQKMFEVQQRVEINRVIGAMDRMARDAGPGGGAIAERIPAQDLVGTKIRVADVASLAKPMAAALRRSGLEKADQESVMADAKREFRDSVKLTAMQAGLSADDRQNMLDTIDLLFDGEATKTIFQTTDTNEKGEPIVYLWEGGQRIPIRMGDNRIAKDIFDGFAAMGGESNVFVDVAALGTQALRAGITKAPAYILTNYLRDQLSTWILSDNFLPFVTGAKGLKNVVTNDATAKRYAAFAGLMGGVDANLIDQTANRHDVLTLRRRGFFATPAKSGIGQAWQTFLRGAEITEAGTRFGHFEAAYQRALKDGFSPEEAAFEAAYAAHDVIDFSRRGSKMMGISRMVAFLNAALQGLDSTRRGLMGDRDAGKPGTYRQLITPYVKAATGSPITIVEKEDLPHSARVFTKMVAIGFIGLALSALYEDDDEYEEFNDYMKATHWFFKVNGTWYRFPKPFDLAIFSQMFEGAFDAYWKQDPRAKEKFVNSLYHTMMPPHEINIANLYFEMSSGIDTFRNREIVPMELSKLPPELQFGAYTSEFGRMMGAITGQSPQMIDHFMGGMFGTIGRDVLALSDYALPKFSEVTGVELPNVSPTPKTEKSFEDQAILSRFTRRAARGSLSGEQFWKQMKQNGGEYISASEGYKKLKEGGRGREARDLLQNVSPDQRAFAILEGEFSEKEQDLHPLNRARQVMSALSGLRKQMVLGNLYKGELDPSDAEKKGEEAEQIVVRPATQKVVNEILEDLSMREARNALIVVGHPGWAQKDIMPTDALWNELREASPEVAEELEARMSKGRNKVYSFEAVREFWPQARELLLTQGPDADLSDLVFDARTWEPPAEGGGLMRLGGPTDADLAAEEPLPPVQGSPYIPEPDEDDDSGWQAGVGEAAAGF